MAENTPGILNWNRLEPRPRTEDFDRTLRVEVRDPLWMMTRQWQFGEFQAEDTGSALFSRVHMKTSKLNKIKLGNEATRDISNVIPLESEVEKEAFEYDLLMRIEMGRYWEQLLAKKIIRAGYPQADVDDIISEFRDPSAVVDLNFYLPDETNSVNSDFYSNLDLWQATVAVTDGRGIDGKKLYDSFFTNSILPLAYVTVYIPDATIQTILTESKTAFGEWFERNYAQPDANTNSAWNANQLEYQFACSAPNADTLGSDVLVADEYYQGRLNWYAFDYEKNSANYDPALEAYDADLLEEKNFSLIPTPVTFAGMPNSRWWQMEDRRVDFGDINPATSDTSKIIFSEFGLIYSNDWMIFPYTSQVGSICDLKEIIVTDCFGQRTKVVSANQGITDDWKRWSFFGISSKRDEALEADTRLFIPTVTDKILEGDPIESVSFIRDEMANMVWGIEKIIPNGLGEGVDGYETALKHADFIKSLSNLPADTLESNDANIEYKVANSVPENWIPFIPVKLNSGPLSRQVQLQRAAMPRYIEGISAEERVRPRTNLLLASSPFYIHEEEVTRSGTVVNTTWQRTRTENGTVVTWLGRRKKNGKGEGSSNLSYDNLEDKKDVE